VLPGTIDEFVLSQIENERDKFRKSQFLRLFYRAARGSGTNPFVPKPEDCSKALYRPGSNVTAGDSALLAVAASGLQCEFSRCPSNLVSISGFSEDCRSGASRRHRKSAAPRSGEVGATSASPAANNECFEQLAAAGIRAFGSPRVVGVIERAGVAVGRLHVETVIVRRERRIDSGAPFPLHGNAVGAAAKCS
jgi:hypothetical protein